MSYYASLPGSFLPPFFSFGASTGAVEKEQQQETSTEPKSDGVDTSHVQLSNKNNSTPSSPSASYASSLNNISPSAFKALALSTDTSDDCKASAHNNLDAQRSNHSPQPSDIIIAIRSARVNPVELIKSLTSTGRNVARRTANFIARTPDIDNNVTESVSTNADANNEESSKNNEEEVSIVSRPGLCYEDTDSDEEYSMYDYSDDFSTPNDDMESDFGHGENASCCGSSSDNGDDPSAIEFELSITFQGRKYNATRAFPTFVKLREDLLSEMNNNNDRHYHRSNRRNCSSTGGGGKSHLFDSQCSTGNTDKTVQKEVPELPRVSPESLGHGGYASMSGVARSGFALLQATAQHYCPEMEHWMRQVIDTFPCSQSLSSFLWEPLSSSNAEWETIGEEGNRDVDDDEKLNSLNDASGGKPPMHRSKANSPKCKPKPKVNMPLRRNKSMGSVGSLLSIQEGNDDDCEHEDW